VTRRQFLLLIVPLLAVLGAFLALVLVERQYGFAGVPWDARTFSVVRDRMAEDCVWGIGDEQKAREAEFNAINEWLRTFDDYAAVTPPWDVQRQRQRSSGRYPGIGVRIDESDPARLQLIGVKPGGPAHRAGLKVGESIVRVEGESIADLARQGETAVQDAIRGPRGTSVELTVQAGDGTLRDIDVFRDWIETGTVFGVRWADEERGIGYIRVSAFKNTTVREFRTAISELDGSPDGSLDRQEGALKALVLDLRANKGGLLDQAVQLADLFLPGGVIVRQRGRREEFTETYEADEEKTPYEGLPLAILVDHGSASASEILASALRDHCRAVLVGEQTFGKFLVQVVEEIETDAGLALFTRTTSFYETPNGHHYPRRVRETRPEDDPLAGIPPDIRVPLRNGEKRKLYFGIFRDEEFREWNPAAEPVHPDFVDPQLAAAVAALRGDPVVTRIQ